MYTTCSIFLFFLSNIVISTFNQKIFTFQKVSDGNRYRKTENVLLPRESCIPSCMRKIIYLRVTLENIILNEYKSFQTKSNIKYKQPEYLNLNSPFVRPRRGIKPAPDTYETIVIIRARYLCLWEMALRRNGMLLKSLAQALEYAIKMRKICENNTLILVRRVRCNNVISVICPLMNGLSNSDLMIGRRDLTDLILFYDDSRLQKYNHVLSYLILCFQHNI